MAMTQRDLIRKAAALEKQINELRADMPPRVIRRAASANGATGVAGSDGADGEDFQFVEAATKAALAAATEPNFAHTTGAAKRYYVAHGSSWDALDFLE